jgi:hypothetical protein
LTLTEVDTSSTYAVTADFKIYLKRESLSGFYIAPYFKYRLRKNNALDGIEDGFLFFRPDRKYEVWAGYGAGTSFGYQIVFPKGFTMDPFLGIGHYFHQNLISETKYTKDQKEQHKPWKYDVRLGLLLGYAF